MEPRALIVFDMDGVLIDVSGSYREVVRQTTRLFFRGSPAWGELPDPLFSLPDLAGLKQSGGLNNDWDLTCQAISLLFSLVDAGQDGKDTDPRSLHEKTMRQCDLSPLIRFLAAEDRPLTALMARRGKKIDPLIARFYRDDVGSGNLVKQTFQELYLGSDLFESTHGFAAEAYHGEGYITRERPLIETEVLDRLAEEALLAIATGRPRLEADYTLERFDLKGYFPVIYSHDDCVREEKRILAQENRSVSLGKPDPYMLDAIRSTLGKKVGKGFYVGDMPDDMVAASRARPPFVSIGYVASAADKSLSRDILSKAGAGYIIEGLDALGPLVARQAAQ